MDRYDLLSVLGSGSFGEVYKAQHRKTGAIVAIKRLHDHIPSFSHATGLTEVNCLRRLQALSSSSSSSSPSGQQSSQSHQNIVQVFECIREADGSMQFVFEYMEDGNLYDLIRRAIKVREAEEAMISSNDPWGQPQSPLTHPRIQSILFQTLSGLAFIHERGYFHRDVKPENILLSGNTVKIADMGLAKPHGAHHFTDYVATRWYRSPEVLLQKSRYGQAVDSFAVGCIVAELYNLCPLFAGSNEIDQLWKIWGVTGIPTEETWSEGVRLAEQMGMSQFPVMVPYERRGEYREEQARLQQFWAERQRQVQEGGGGGGKEEEDATVAATATAAAVMPEILMNAILHTPLDRMMRTAPASAQRLTAELLVLDPAKRLDAADALRHDYFASMESDDGTATAVATTYTGDSGVRSTSSSTAVKKRGRSMSSGGQPSVAVATAGAGAEAGGGGQCGIAMFAESQRHIVRRQHQQSDASPIAKRSRMLSSAAAEERQDQPIDERMANESGGGNGHFYDYAHRGDYWQQQQQQQQQQRPTTRRAQQPQQPQQQQVPQPYHLKAPYPLHSQKMSPENDDFGASSDRLLIEDLSTNLRDISPAEPSELQQQQQQKPRSKGGFDEWLLAGKQRKSNINQQRR